MTDTPKDRDDEAVEVFAQAIATAMGEGLHGASPGFKRVAAAVLSDARSAGYIVARPVADEGLREELLSTIADAHSNGNESYDEATDVMRAIYAACVDVILPLIHAREAALRAERDQAVRALKGAGWTLLDGAQEWRPPLGKRPDFEQIDKLRSDLQQWTAAYADLHEKYVSGRAERDAALAALAEAEKRCETMREALVPFAEEAPSWVGFDDDDATDSITVGSLRRARAATGAER